MYHQMTHKLGYELVYESQFGDFQYRRDGDLVRITNHTIELVGNIKTKQLLSFQTYRIYPFMYHYEDLHIKIPALTRLKYRGAYVKCRFVEFGGDEDHQIIIKTTNDSQWLDFNQYNKYDEKIYIPVNWFTTMFLELLGRRFKNTNQVAQSIWQRFQTHFIQERASDVQRK
jgi:hypothetical protein